MRMVVAREGRKSPGRPRCVRAKTRSSWEMVRKPAELRRRSSVSGKESPIQLRVALPEWFSKGRTRTTRPPGTDCAARAAGESAARMRKNIFVRKRLAEGAGAIGSSVAEWVWRVPPPPSLFAQSLPDIRVRGGPGPAVKMQSIQSNGVAIRGSCKVLMRKNLVWSSGLSEGARQWAGREDLLF